MCHVANAVCKVLEGILAEGHVLGVTCHPAGTLCQALLSLTVCLEMERPGSSFLQSDTGIVYDCNEVCQAQISCKDDRAKHGVAH